MVDNETYECSAPGCEMPVAQVRCTQFAGDHPFCQGHADQERDIIKSNDEIWYPLEAYKVVLQVREERKMARTDKDSRATQRALDQEKRFAVIAKKHGVSVNTALAIFHAMCEAIG